MLYLLLILFLLLSLTSGLAAHLLVERRQMHRRLRAWCRDVGVRPIPGESYAQLRERVLTVLRGVL